MRTTKPSIFRQLFSFLIALIFSATAWAADLGEVQLHSGMGEPFKANIPIDGISSNVMVPSCFRAKIETAEGKLLANPQILFERFDGNRNTVLIKLGGTAPITEPAIRLTLELVCDGAVKRVYPLLLDVPELGKHGKPLGFNDAVQIPLRTIRSA